MVGVTITPKSRLAEFNRILDARTKAIQDGVVELATESVVNGSTLTGAPGQPEDLREKFQTVPESDTSAIVGVTDPSARSVEDGISYAFGGVPAKLHSAIGGFHSFKLTEAALPRLAQTMVQRTGGRK